MVQYKSYMVGWLIMVLLTFSACSDKFLEKDLLGEITPENAWKTPENALMGLTACYDGLQSRYLYDGGAWQCGFFYMDAMTDNGGHFNWSGWMAGYDITNGTHTSNSWLVGDFWSALYEVIKRCNVLLENIDQVQMDESAKETYKAEAKVIRALMYLYLTSTYHDVPYITEVPTSISEVFPKSTRETIVEAEMKNLAEAAQVLTQTAPRGRITKGAALSILGRMALYNEEWDKAIAAYQEVMGLGYTLDNDYSTLFTEAGETSNEIIFAVRFAAPGLSEGSHFNGHWNAPMEAINGTLDFANAFYSIDGKPFNESTVTMPGEDHLDINKPDSLRYKNRDPRLKATLFVPGMKWRNNPTEFFGGSAPSLSTVYVYKYFNPQNTNADPEWGEGGQDFYVVRYAEVLLSMAEALIRRGGYDYNQVTTLINDVRNRVGMPQIEESEGKGGTLSTSQLLEVLKHERRVETGFEGLRLYDLYRWKELDKAAKAINDEAAAHTNSGSYFNYEYRNFRGEKEYVWPIPLNEVDASNGVVTQHDLWK